MVKVMACGIIVVIYEGLYFDLAQGQYGIIVSEFELRSHYYVHFRTNTFGKSMNPLILPAMG